MSAAKTTQLRARLIRDWMEVRCRDDAADVGQSVVELASALALFAQRETTREDRAYQEQMKRLMADDGGKHFTTSLSDQLFRARDLSRAADQIRHLMEDLGVPDYLGVGGKLQLEAFRVLSPWVPSLLVPAVRQRVRSEMSGVLIDGDEEPLRRHLAARRREGVRINLNHLGESILGEHEAEERLGHYLEAASRSDVASISVKISSIASNLEVLAWESTLERLAERMRRLYRCAMASPYRASDGSWDNKLVYLDMEEYRDLALTAELFIRVLSEPEFRSVTAGIVLQAYLPDSHPVQRRLTEWALKRVETGGAAIRIRLVKGANLAMERVDAAVHGWKQTPYATKEAVDANYKRMVDWGCEPRRSRAVRLGIGSHNLFDIAFALFVRARRGVEEFVEFEMLEGMAEPIRRAVGAVAGGILVYAPAVRASEMASAIAYLIRRLDENTSEENFLRHSFDLEPQHAEWTVQAQKFLDAHARRFEVVEGPRRDQVRTDEPAPSPPSLDSPFQNEPDTDWSLPWNREWIRPHLDHWRQASQLDLSVGVPETEDGPADRVRIGRDPSVPGRSLYRVRPQGWPAVDASLHRAVAAGARWAARSVEERGAVLARVAEVLRRRRGEALAVMMADGGKALRQSDPEVSEAIDFAEYYWRSAAAFSAFDDLELHPRGVVLVAPPWNFPLAIPAGGVCAALAVGSTVLLKPAPEVVLVGHFLAECFWEAGVPRDVLQLVVCDDEPEGSRLVRDPRVASVILTGGTETARLFRRLRPGLDLHAETGGKNATIVTELADRDLAIGAVVQSAFGHAGQKCSATSLLICEAGVYDDEGFRRRLVDAARSLPVGPAWEPESVVTPLIAPPAGPLEWALTSLDPGERWLLEPKRSAHNPALWSPGIKIHVRPGSRSHLTEFFGPVLSVMRAENLDEAIRLANEPAYGLTSGLHSLDQREQAYWAERIDAGNLYINRGTTGAIVQRQPFGGRKASSVGAGAKAGGPNYILQLAQVEQVGLPACDGTEVTPSVSEWVESIASALSAEDQARLRAAARSYAYWWREHFSVSHDPSAVLGEDNLFRYQSGSSDTTRPGFRVLVRAGREAALLDIALSVAAARTCSTPLVLSVTKHLERAWGDRLHGLDVVFESSLSTAHNLDDTRPLRVRLLGRASAQLAIQAERRDLFVDHRRPLLNGRAELPFWLREQSLTVTTHRYGNLASTGRKPTGQ